MTPREIVLRQIAHQETKEVPYTLSFEDEVGTRLDRHFGGKAWRDRKVPYVVSCGSIGRPPKQELDATHHRDVFGTVWRTDELPGVVVEAGLKAPSFQGYAFPTALGAKVGNPHRQVVATSGDGGVGDAPSGPGTAGPGGVNAGTPGVNNRGPGGAYSGPAGRPGGRASVNTRGVVAGCGAAESVDTSPEMAGFAARVAGRPRPRTAIPAALR